MHGENVKQNSKGLLGAGTVRKWLKSTLVATVQNRGKYAHLGCYVVDVSRSAGERVFLFSCERLGRVCRKLLSLVFWNFEFHAKMVNIILIEVTWKFGHLRWLNFVKENCLRGDTSCLPWKWLICFRIWCQTFPQKLWVLRFQDLQFLWLIFEAPYKYFMSGKHSVNLSIFAGALNLLPNFQERERGRGGLDMTNFFRWVCWGRWGWNFSGECCGFYIKIN